MTSFITKSASLTWQEGTSEGGLAPNVNLLANSTYYIFAIGTLPIDATNGTFTTPDISSNIIDFQSVSNGNLRVVVDGITQNLTNLDFTGINDLNGIALILNSSSLSGCSVSVSNNKLVFTSLSTGSTSTVNISGIPGGSGTDISLSNYLNATDGTITNGTNFVRAKVDIGFDTNETATNLLNTAELPYTTGYRYYRKIGLFKTDSSSNIVVCDETENKLATSFNNISSYGLHMLRVLMTPDYSKKILVAEIPEGDYTATEDGYIYFIYLNKGDEIWGEIWVNGEKVYYNGSNANYGEEAEIESDLIPVKQGDKIHYKFRNTVSRSVFLIPYCSI